MDGFGQSIGNAISGVMGGIMESVRSGLAGIGDAAVAALPSAPVFILAFVVVAGVAWLLLKR